MASSNHNCAPVAQKAGWGRKIVALAFFTFAPRPRLRNHCEPISGTAKSGEKAINQVFVHSEMSLRLMGVRSALFMPASNPRAIAKVPNLAADLIILDLEDAVRDTEKDTARNAAISAAAQFGPRLNAIRANGAGSLHHADDLAAIAQSNTDLLVLPKVEDIAALDAAWAACEKPIIAMIETCTGLYASRAIAAHPAVVGLFAGTNDLAAELGLDLNSGRDGLSLALQMIVMAARASGKAVLDGVNNALDETSALELEAVQARQFGFTGKTAIHPKQIEPINRIFSPTRAQIDDALALIEAAKGGAERFRGRMIEAMHVAAARAIVAQSDAFRSGDGG